MFKLLATLCLAAAPAVCFGEAETKLTYEGIERTGTFVTLLPGLAKMAAPEWAQPGIRVSHYQASASVLQSRDYLIEDPNGPYEDPRTGKHYRDNFADFGEEQASASGEGLTQTDIVATEGNAIAVISHRYVVDRTKGTITAADGGTGQVALASNLGDTWIHPQALAQLKDTNVDGSMIVRGPWKANDKTFDTVRGACWTKTRSRETSWRSGRRGPARTGSRPLPCRAATRP